MARIVVITSGKGGVGKTTTAAAHAVAAAGQGQRVLLVSTDPAHNLGDALGRSLDGRPTRIRPNLDALEIDPDAECTAYIGRVKENIRATVRSNLLEEAERHIDMAASSPGTYEAALFDRIVAILLDEARPGAGGAYDQVVFDTAPTGHTVRLLALPELMGAWVDGLLRRRQDHNRDRSQWLGEGEVPEDPLFDLLSERRRRIAAVRDLLLDPGMTAFVFVLTPEHLPVEETRRALAELDEHQLRVGALVVNKVLPEEADGSFVAQRRAAEAEHLAAIERHFADRRRYYVPLRATDIRDLDDLQAIAEHLQD